MAELAATRASTSFREWNRQALAILRNRLSLSCHWRWCSQPGSEPALILTRTGEPVKEYRNEGQRGENKDLGD